MAGPGRIRRLPERDVERAPRASVLDAGRFRLCGRLAVSINRSWRVEPDTAPSDAPYKARAPLAYWSAEGDADLYLAAVAAHEAYWLGFEAETGSYGVIAEVDGVNPLTGDPAGPATLSRVPENFVLVPDQPWLDSLADPGGRPRQMLPEYTEDGDPIGATLRLTAFELDPGVFVPQAAPDADEVKPLYAPGATAPHPWQSRRLRSDAALPGLCGGAVVVLVRPEAFRDLTGKEIDMKGFLDTGPAPTPFDPFA